jgi:ATP-dependent RNA helicase DeaD
MLAGRDVVGQARTGSGKTLAFGIPLLALCDPNLPVPQALVLVPTRELAAQVARVIDQLAPVTRLRAAQIYGGRDLAAQMDLLKSGPQIIIGTPGRMLDHLYRGSLSFKDLRVLILDEADQMLDQGFADDIDRIFDCKLEKVQIALFSATVPEWVHEVISHRLHEPVSISVEETNGSPVDCVEQTVLEVPANRKLDALRELLMERGAGSVLVFARTKIGVERLGNQINAMGFRAAALQGNLGQSQRERILRGFRRGNPPILVATNVAARGLDILSIERVINFDLPDSPEMLTHRVGRTGRMGRYGSAITLMTPADARKWRLIEKELNLQIRRERWGDSQEAAVADHSVESRPPSARQAKPRRPAQGNGSASNRARIEVICATCGEKASVRFQPKGDRPVYCSPCYRARRESSAA